MVEIVLRQGLVHPMTCVPQLIALEVDQLEVNWKLAHRLLLHMNEKCVLSLLLRKITSWELINVVG